MAFDGPQDPDDDGMVTDVNERLTKSTIHCGELRSGSAAMEMSLPEAASSARHPPLPECAANACATAVATRRSFSSSAKRMTT